MKVFIFFHVYLHSNLKQMLKALLGKKISNNVFPLTALNITTYMLALTCKFLC